MNRKELWESIKENKWTIWKYFRIIYWTALFILALYFIIDIAVSLMF